MANFFDQFDTDPAMPAAGGGGKNFFDQFDAPVDGGGLYKAVDAGVAKGMAGLVGLPHAINEVGSRGIAWAEKKLGIESRPDLYKLGFDLPTTQGTEEAIRKEFYGGQPLYEPQNRTERYAKNIGEFVPGAFAGPGGVVRKLVGYAAAPGIASEAAGEATKGTAYEQPARVGAALVAGGAASLTARPSTAAQTLRANLPEGVTPQMVERAGTLIDDAAQQGVTLSWPEALSQVSGRPVLSDLARHLEAPGPTQARMADFYAQRPQQVETAGRAAMGNLGPASANPSLIGPQAGEAATEVLDRVRGAINTATRPSYDAAQQSLVPQNVHAAMRQDPLFVQALDAIRNDPARNSFVRGLSDRSSVVYDAVKKELEERARNAASPANPNASQQVSAATGSLGGDVRRIAVASDRAAMGLQPGQGVGNLEHALAEQARLREQYLEPLQRGPLGKIADKDITTQRAMNALFPANPLPNSAQEIETTVRALSGRSPNVAGQLVRAHAESVFNEATQALQSGANQAGGAKFRAVLVGNPQQRANFEAAVEALPHGPQRLEGFNRFLDIVEATGTRQNIGSKTAYNAEFLRQASSSGIVGEVAKGAANPISRFTQGLIDRYERWRLGQNLNQLADILTNPAAVNQLRAIAQLPVNSPRSLQIALRVATLSRPGGTPAQQPRD